MCKPEETLLNGAYTFLPNFNDSNPIQTRRRRILKFVIPITLLLCFATFTLGLLFGFQLRPQDIKVSIEQANMRQFQLVNNNTVYCKLALVMVFRNPNNRAGVRYKRIRAISYYEGNRFGSVTLPKFHQGRDSINTFYPVYEGMARMPMNWRWEEFYKAKDVGFVDVEVRVHAWIKYKMWFLKGRKRMVEIVCGMNKVALADNESNGNIGFKGTKCDVEM